ncbi:MAG TPA: formate dehydrogenase subunit gamma [Alphaproteobacteria bacterium]|nr:formate dehydrogenase subunit gamma [Alphaproteobacteria bacterium]
MLCALALCWLVIQVTPAIAQQQDRPIDPNASVTNEQTLLRKLNRIHGRIDIPNKTAANLEQPAGRAWRFYHEVLLHWGAAVIILGVIGLLAVAYAFLGRQRLAAGRSGVKVRRFNGFERFSHWLTATSFVVLALTGLNITFGKLLLLPLIGPSAFSRLSELGKFTHDFTSFAFVVGLVLIVALWLEDNFIGKVDVIWLRQGGGFVGGKHPPAGRFNAGEKLVFWLVVAAGLGVAVSGYLLLFPFYVTNIAGMQIAQVAHSAIAVLFIALIIGHIYIGTLGMEGAFEAMGTGSVDLNWAKQHHRLWYEDEVAKGDAPARPPRSAEAAAE